MRNRKLKTLAVCLAIGIAVAGGGALAAHLLSPWLVRLNLVPNDKMVDFHTYFSIEEGVTTLVWGNARITTGQAPLYENGEAYLPVSIIRGFVDPFIFMDEYADSLFVTNRSAVLEFKPGEFLKRNGAVYIPAGLFMQLYPYRVSYYEALNIVTIDGAEEIPRMARVIKRTGVRYHPEANSEMAIEAMENETVTVYKPEGEFTFIRTKDGLPGYVLTKDIRDLTAAEAEQIELEEPPAPLAGEYIVNTEPSSPRWPSNVKINMMWDGVYGAGGDKAQMSEPVPAGVNVLSPTWFNLDKENISTLKSFADETSGYVEWAHAQGISVWPRVVDDGFDLTEAVLTDRALRKSIIEQICAYAESMGVDGINMDFETVREEVGDYYIQFLRELAVGLGDKILSVDVLVPQAWSEYYRRGDMALFVDFLCVMTYDEHYEGGNVSGPVASLPFVEKGVADMLAVAPEEKLIMGLPFFNRVWIVIPDTGEIYDTLAIGMESAKGLLIENGVTEPEWNETVGSFYGEYAYIEDDKTLLAQVWLEDENSIREKLKIFTKNDLAGVTGWSRGFENAAVHEILRNAVASGAD